MCFELLDVEWIGLMFCINVGQVGLINDHLAGHVREGRMQDVLLAATHETGAMIEENLNGISFAKSRMALSNLVQTLQLKREYLDSIKTEISQIDAKRRQDVWQLLQREVSPRTDDVLLKTSD